MSDHHHPCGGQGSYARPTSSHADNNAISHPINQKDLQWVYNPNDGTILLDHHNEPVSVDRLLATKPLRHELSTRPGPGGKKLTYISGEGVSRTLNDIFGFDGWNLDVTAVNEADCCQDDKGRYTVVYTAQVRLTHKASGTYKEDVGAGDATDRSKGTAMSNAMKASITDAMKRAARHFGDKLGNSLYQGNFTIGKAPVSLQQALDDHAIERAKTKFGFVRGGRRSSDGEGRTSANIGDTLRHIISEPVPAISCNATMRPSLPSSPPPLPTSAPLNPNLIPVPIILPAPNRYHRGQVQTNPEVMHRQYDDSSSVATSNVPPLAILPRPLPPYDRAEGPFLNSSSSSICGDRISLQCLPTSANDFSATHKASIASTGTTAVLTLDQTPLSATNKRPPLSTVPANAAPSGRVGACNESKKAKTQQPQQQHPSSVGSNPYHSAGPSSSSAYSSSCPKTSRHSF